MAPRDSTADSNDTELERPHEVVQIMERQINVNLEAELARDRAELEAELARSRLKLEEDLARVRAEGEKREALIRASHNAKRRIQDMLSPIEVLSKKDYVPPLSVEPPDCSISVAGGVSKHTLTNRCDRALSFKIAVCPHDSIYTVDMSLGLLQVGQQVDIQIHRKPGQMNGDFVGILYADVSAEERDPATPFKELDEDGPIVGEITGAVEIRL